MTFNIRELRSWLKSKRRYSDERWREVYDLFDEGRFSEAYEIFLDVVRNHPAMLENGDVSVLFAELELFANNNCSKAQELLERAEKQGFSPELKVVFYRVRGMARCMSDRYDEVAVRDLEECVALDPCPRHLALLAQCLSVMGDNRAPDAWDCVLKKDFSNCMAHLFLGIKALESGDSGKAALLAKRAERLDPTADESVQIGYLYQELGDFSSAIRMYHRANDLGHAAKGQVFASIAACYISQGQMGTAKKYVEWALRFKPDDDYVKEVWQEYRTREDAH